MQTEMPHRSPTIGIITSVTHAPAFALLTESTFGRGTKPVLAAHLFRSFSLVGCQQRVHSSSSFAQAADLRRIEGQLDLGMCREARNSEPCQLTRCPCSCLRQPCVEEFLCVCVQQLPIEPEG